MKKINIINYNYDSIKYFFSIYYVMIRKTE